MTAPTRISHSRLRCWRSCRRKYWYQHIEKLKPKRIQRPLVFGKSVHKILEHMIEGSTAESAIEEIQEERKQIFTSDQDDFDQIVTDATDVMQSYHKYWEKDPIEFYEIDGKKAEHKFEVPLGSNFLLTGIIDVFPETVDGRRWVGEHKSHKQMPTEDARMRDLQGMIYLHVAKTHFKIKRISGVMWDYIRSKSPPEPELLKNGTLSKRRIDTLPHVYERAIINHGLKRADYVDILGDLDDKLSTWFKRILLPFNQGAVDVLLEETLVTAREMHRKGGVDTTRSISRDCSWCSYERLCHADLFGLDGDYLRQREFRVEEGNHAEKEIESE